MEQQVKTVCRTAILGGPRGKMTAFTPASPQVITTLTERDIEAWAKHPEDIQSLMRILSHSRAFRSNGEKSFVAWLRNYLLALGQPVETLAGNLVVTIGDASSTLFSCHTDTVHHTCGRKAPHYDPKTGIIHSPKKNQDILGADDGGGIWLMLEMIRHGVPGVYVFHEGEEVGGVGASAMTREEGGWLTGFRRAIAFDRKGVDSIVTHQGWSDYGASDTFASALAAGLKKVVPSLQHRPDDTGIFTDTALYTDFIPECTNVSIGYENAHTEKEALDTAYLRRLRDACLHVDWENLPVERKVGERREETGYSWKGYSRRQGGSGSREMEDLIRGNEDIVAELLAALGYTTVDLQVEIEERGGML